MADSREQFSSTTLALHWAIGLTIIILLAVGLWMTELEKGPFRNDIYGYHKLAGTTVLMLAAVRILWRWRNGLPLPASDYPEWQHRLSVAVHIVLLVATVGMPITGAVLSYGHGHPVPILGLYNIGPPAEKIGWLGNAGSFLHYWGGWALIGIITLHVVGALKHHYGDKDGTLRRMLGTRIG